MTKRIPTKLLLTLLMLFSIPRPAHAATSDYGVFIAATAQNTSTASQSALINVAVGLWKKAPDGSIKPLTAFALILGVSVIDAGTVQIGVVGGEAQSISVTNGNTVVFTLNKARYLVSTGTVSSNSNQINFTQSLNVDATGQVGFYIGAVDTGGIGVIGSEFKDPATQVDYFAYQLAVPETAPSGKTNMLSLTENLGASSPIVKKLMSKKGKTELRKLNANVRKLYSKLAQGIPVTITPPVSPPAGNSKR